MPFTSPLEDDGFVDEHVGVAHNLFSLRFNFCMGFMYVEQDMHDVDGVVSKTILMQKNTKVRIVPCGFQARILGVFIIPKTM